MGSTFSEAIANDRGDEAASVSDILVSYLQQRHRLRREIAPPPVDVTIRRLITPPCEERRTGGKDDMHASFSVVTTIGPRTRARYKLSSLDLREVRAAEADLDEADLSGTLLSNGDLRNAQLNKTLLDAADLTRACLQEANLKEAFSELFATSFRGADLTGADMQRSTFVSASFDHATLRGVDLRKSNLTNAKFVGTDLRDAQLQGGDSCRGRPCRADIRGIDLDQRALESSGAKVDGCTRTSWKPKVRANCARSDD